MNIYIDIDGVLLTKRDTKPAPYLKEFLEHVTKYFDVYWLTTHCKGDASYTLNYLKTSLPEPLLSLLSEVKPTSWDLIKTDAIDFSKDFLWLDDYCMQKELQVLKDKGVAKSLLKIDLQENPKQLLDITNWLKREHILDIVFSSNRKMPAHQNSRGDRKQTFGIDSEYINGKDDYEMASQAFNSKDRFLRTLPNLTSRQLDILLKVGEDCMLAGYFKQKMYKDLDKTILINAVIKENINLWENYLNNEDLQMLKKTDVFSIFSSYYTLGKGFVQK